MCDIDLKTCETSSKLRKKDVVDLGKKCGVDPYLSNGREKTRKVICTEIVNQYSANPSSSSSESEDNEGLTTNSNIMDGDDPLCKLSEKKCLSLDKIDLLALGEHCGVEVYGANGNMKPTKSICKSLTRKHGSSPPKVQQLNVDVNSMDVNSLKKLAKKLNIDWKNKDINELQYVVAKKLKSMRSVSPSRSLSKSSSPTRLISPSAGIQNIDGSTSPVRRINDMKKKELLELAKALGASQKKVLNMDKDDLVKYILSRKKSPSRSPSPKVSPARKSRSQTPKRQRSRTPSPQVGLHVSPKYRSADLLGKKVAELRELAKLEGLKKWKDKTPSKMLKQDFVDFLLHVGSGLKPSKTPSPIRPLYSPKTRAELLLLKVPELKALALSYGLKKFKDKTPSQLRKNDFVDFIVSNVSTQKQKSRSPSPIRYKSPKQRSRSPSKQRSASPPKYKSKELEPTTDESEDEIVVKKPKKKKVKSSNIKPPPMSVRRSRSPSKVSSIKSRSRSPSIVPNPSNSPSLIVTPPPSVKKQPVIQPDLPKYTGDDAEHDLEILAHDQGFKVVPIKGDGNCLFRAIAKSLRLNHSTNYTHKKLREMVVVYLTYNQEFLEPYLEYVTVSGETTPKEYARNVKRYIKKISTPGEWGDFICLRVLSEILQVQFNLLILNTGLFQVISNNADFIPLIPLGFIDDYHYTALVPEGLVAPSIRPSVAPSIRPSVAPSIRPSVVPGSVAPSIRPSVAPSIRPSVVPGSVAPSIRPSVAPGSVVPSIRPSVVPGSVVPSPSIRPSIRPSVVPGSVRPSVAPSVVPGSVRPSVAPSIRPSVVPGSVRPSPTPSIAPQIPPPVFGKVKPLSSVNELLEIMDKVKPYVYDDISQLLNADRQIMVSLGM